MKHLKNVVHQVDLSKIEFINFYQKLLTIKYLHETYCEFLFQAFDYLSKDGFIQFDEYLTCYLYT